MVPLWHEIPSFQACCGHLRELSNSLVGELIFENHNPRVGVALRVEHDFPEGGEGEGKEIIFHAQNTMTRETAFGLLHFLSHFHGTVFTSIENYRFALLNQRVIDLLPARKLRCRGYFLADRLPTLTQLEKVGDRVAFDEIILRPFLEPLNVNTLGEAIRLATSAGHLCRVMDINLKPALVGQLIEVC